MIEELPEGQIERIREQSIEEIRKLNKSIENHKNEIEELSNPDLHTATVIFINAIRNSISSIKNAIRRQWPKGIKNKLKKYNVDNIPKPE